MGWSAQEGIGEHCDSSQPRSHQPVDSATPRPRRANSVCTREMASRPLQVGIAIIPDTDSLDRMRALVRVADEGGLALVGIQDHPYQHHFFDTWSLIPTLLAETRRISFFTNVANLPLHPAAVMAKAAASLDVLSGGRFELGLGG